MAIIGESFKFWNGEQILYISLCIYIEVCFVISFNENIDII